MKRFLMAPVVALVVTLLFGAVVHADPSPPPSLVQWNYNASPGSPTVPGDGSPPGGISFTNEPLKLAVGTSDIVLTNLRTFSSALGKTPESVAGAGAYTLSLSLSMMEGASTFSKTLVFSGNLSGTFSKENANIANVFGADSTQTAQLGSYTFTVSLAAYTPPGPFDQSNAGSIAAHVAVSRLTPADTPEPSTMLLAGLGLSFLGGAAWRRRARSRAEACA